MGAVEIGIGAGRSAGDVRELLLTLFETLPEGLVVQEADGRISAANPAACSILMLGLDELLGRDSRDPRWRAIRPDGTPWPGEEHPSAVAMRTGRPVQGAVMGLRILADGETRWISVNAVPCFAPGRAAPAFAYSTFRDVTEQVRREQVTAARTRLLELATRSTLPELLTAALDEAEALTRSRIGFFHFVDPDERALTLQAWSTATTRTYCTAAGPSLHYPLDQAGVWADAVRQRRPLLQNDYASHPGRRGLPDGHAALVRELVVPILRDGRVCAVLGVGNKETPYLEGDVQVASQFGDLAWDICAKLRADVALAERERTYRLLADHAHDVIWTLDLASQRYGYVSPSIQALRGLTVEEALAEPVERSLTPESLARVQGVMARIGTPEEEDPHTGIYDQPCKGGAVKHVEITTSLVRDAAGRPVEVVGVSRDATARVEAQRAMAASEERFRALIERSSDLTLVLDERETITFASPSVQERLAIPPAALVGHPGDDFAHPEDTARARALFRRFLADPSLTLTFDMRLRHADGTWRLFEAQARNLLEVPSVRGVVINHRDVTERNRLREQVQQSQKLESVGRLAGGVAHDFNNLLTVILAACETLRERLPAGDGEAALDVDQIQAAGERARDLTGQLLAFARKQVIAPVLLDLNTAVRRAERMLGRLLGEDVELRVDLAPAPWAVHADPSQVEQVLLNLVVNARDAMPRGGTLTIATRNASPHRHDGHGEGGPRDGEWVELLVRDTGTGMSPEALEHLFEPFFTTKDQGKGTGLGLATIYGIVAQAGGHVSVESAPGRGTTFRVCLPRAAGDVAAAPARPAAGRAAGSEAILVVEDDLMVRGVVTRTLSAAGYQVSAVGNPHQALEVPAETLREVRLLLTDVVMPAMDGRELAQELCRRCPSLKVLYLSGYPQEVISRRGVLDAGLAFLAKPFTPAVLLGKVREILEGP